ncbi:hypothetical protein IWW50_000438 [Coemansia erecta]|nr:hypothetical protein IWW50_000438 [Coemansia erecta]
MRIAAPALVAVLCAASTHVCAAEFKPTGVSAADPHASPTHRMPVMLARKQDKEDPANPVAAAATDPNEAAMKIKSRDLVPTNRPGARPEIHHHGHASHDDSDDIDDSGDSDDTDDADAKPSSKSKRKPESSSKDKDQDDERKSTKPSKSGKPGDTASKSDKGKDKKDKKDPKDKKGKKSKDTHTGLDGKEVNDEDAEDAEGDAAEMARKKKVQVQHVQAKRRKWRTGKVKYDYKQALAGWKEVGPMYYYKGKYENAATSVYAAQGFVAIALAGILLA